MSIFKKEFHDENDSMLNVKMQVPTESTILVGILLSTTLSTLFSIIGLSTPGWHFDLHRSLFCDQCSKASSVFAVISMIALIICLIFLVLLLVDMIDPQRLMLMRLIIPLLLLSSTILLLTTLLSYLNHVDPSHGYSYHVTVVSFLCSYFASLLATFWLGSGSYLSRSYSTENN